jgi:hypothetical protein
MRVRSSLAAMAAVACAAGLGIGTATTASAATGHAASPDFTCADRTVCVFSEPGYVGAVDSLATATNHSRWMPLPLYAESINDNSNSAVQLYSDQTGAYRCVTGKENLPSSYELDWIFIAYNEPNCNNVPPF